MNIHLIYRFIPLKEVNLDFLEKQGREEGKMEESKGRRKLKKKTVCTILVTSVLKSIFSFLESHQTYVG